MAPERKQLQAKIAHLEKLSKAIHEYDRVGGQLTREMHGRQNKASTASLVQQIAKSKASILRLAQGTEYQGMEEDMVKGPVSFVFRMTRAIQELNDKVQRAYLSS